MNITGDVLCPYSCTRQMMDQISIAKAFVVVVSEGSSNAQFAAELSAQIQKSQALLTAASAILIIAECETAIRDMALLLHKAQQFHYDSATLIMKMKGQFQSLDEVMKSEAEKSSKYEQIAAEELPKGLFCLSIRLTIQWFTNSNLKRDLSGGRQITEKLRDNSLYHYCVFSDNILAVSVVVNSTTMNSDYPDKVVFHLVTDEVNYAPMRAWFSMNNFRGATIEVQMVEDFSWLNVSYLPVQKQLQNFNFSETGDNNRTPNKLSMLKHLRFYIPEVYPALEKITFLDDDVVVQRDLSELFSINLNGNVMGAVDTCRETFHGFHRYLNYSHPLIRAHFDPDACGWAFGMNVFDLREWRRRNVTEVYHYWQERNANHTLWKLGTLPPGLLTFHGLVENLDAEWHVLGLGHTDVDPSQVENGAVLHYNGRRKPWMKNGMDQYKGLWEKYVDYSHPMLQQCFMRGHSKERLM
ncbi:probable galacturonosyltransferase 10 isoform X2 [Zingiber officinale]|nr:probable galacturonosyltransferase 10 isoform X2 [Zingiber officinale]